MEAGTSIVDLAVADTSAKGEKSLSGDTAFLLHDTYGFPIDLTLEMAAEAGLSVDREAFDTLMLAQRDRAKTDAKSKKSIRADVSVYGEFRASGETVFAGYELLELESTVLGLLVDGESVTRAGASQVVEVILAETPLYAESGGQVSDQGVLEGPGFRAVVSDVQKPVPGLISHTVTIAEGEIGVGDTVKAVVDPVTRYEGARAHSATHLIHAALRDTLGPNATQAGSLNRPGYMRLDFSWNQALSEDAQSGISEITNNAIRDDLEVSTKILPVAEAKAAGAMALFGEKYGDVVRMVDIGGPWSRELCAGTHVGRSSQIGVVTLLGESSVSSTARRIEALVGSAAVADFSVEKSIVRRLTQLLKTPREELPGRIDDLLGQVKTLERQVAKTAQAATGALAPALIKSATDRAGVSVVAEVLSESRGADDIRVLATSVLSGLGDAPAAVVLGSVAEGRGTIVVAANPAGVTAGVHAGNLVKTASTIMGGGGGGKPGLAQGGGPEGASLPAALEAVVAELGKS